MAAAVKFRVGFVEGAALAGNCVVKRFVFVDKFVERVEVRVNQIEISEQVAAFLFNAVHVIFGDGKIFQLNLVMNVGDNRESGFKRFAFAEVFFKAFLQSIKALIQSAALNFGILVNRGVAGVNEALEKSGVAGFYEMFPGVDDGVNVIVNFFVVGDTRVGAGEFEILAEIVVSARDLLVNVAVKGGFVDGFRRRREIFHKVLKDAEIVILNCGIVSALEIFFKSPAAEVGFKGFRAAFERKFFDTKRIS